MKEKIKCTIRYSILALVTGVAVGAIDTIFGRGLLWLSDFRTAHYRYLLPFLPVAGLLIVWMYHRFSEESLKGMTLVLETGQKKRKSIPLALVPLVIVGTWLTHLFGGSAGREGVAVQIGAVISHEAGKKFRCPENDRIMLVAGMAAGFGVAAGSGFDYRAFKERQYDLLAGQVRKAVDLDYIYSTLFL